MKFREIGFTTLILSLFLIGGGMGGLHAASTQMIRFDALGFELPEGWACGHITSYPGETGRRWSCVKKGEQKSFLNVRIYPLPEGMTLESYLKGVEKLPKQTVQRSVRLKNREWARVLTREKVDRPPYKGMYYHKTLVTMSERYVYEIHAYHVNKKDLLRVQESPEINEQP